VARARVRKIDNLFWGTTSNDHLALAGSGVVGATVISVGTQASTLLRIRGEVLVYLDGVQAPGGLARVEMGIILVPEGTGGSIRFDPSADGNAPWLWFGIVHVGYEEAVADVVDVPGITSVRVPVDNKAMRRIRPDVETQFVAANVSIAGTPAVNIAYGFRILQGF